nr:hypothetical protein [Shewanella intestini]
MTYLRHGRKKQQQVTTKYELANEGRFSGAKLSIYCLILLSLSATVAYWGWGWYQDNIIVNVTITSPLEQKTQTYQVRKKDIEMQRITTVDGVQIRLSNQERITITPLAEIDNK